MTVGSSSMTILMLSGVAVIALATFIVHELESPNPVVDLRVFKNRSYAAGTGINFLTGLALFGSSYLFSLYCGSVMHYTALDIGRVFLIAGLAQIVLMPLVGRYGVKYDARLLLAVGVTIVAFSQYLGAQLTDVAGFDDLVAPQLVRAIGLAFIFIPVSVAALSDLPADQRGNATGLFNLTRELGGSLGTALIRRPGRRRWHGDPRRAARRARQRVLAGGAGPPGAAARRRLAGRGDPRPPGEGPGAGAVVRGRLSPGDDRDPVRAGAAPVHEEAARRRRRVRRALTRSRKPHGLGRSCAAGLARLLAERERDQQASDAEPEPGRVAVLHPT